MRRILAIALLLIFSLPVSLPMLSPLLSASASGSTLPACCRRDGKHHCAMLAMETSSSGDTHRVSSLQARCPYSPSSVQLFGDHTDPPHLVAQATLPIPTGLALTLAETEAHYRISSERARHKRGPPAVLPSLL